jgi:hypothetical protein
VIRSVDLTFSRTELPEGVLQATNRSEERGKFKDLLKPSLRRLTLLTWVIWFGSSIVYYGVILFTPGVFERTTGADPNEYVCPTIDSQYS